MQLLLVIVLSFFILKVIPNKTNLSVYSSFSFSKFIILPSPLTPICTSFVFSILTFKPDTEWENVVTVTTARNDILGVLTLKRCEQHC